jgi:hypothetical protein
MLVTVFHHKVSLNFSSNFLNRTNFIANKAVKMTPRIPPKTGTEYNPGGIIRLEFPAQGYINPNNTTLEFDVLLRGPTTTGASITRIQNNIQSLFSRVRLLYGATPIEDIINYNQVVRMLTEWTGTSQVGSLDQTSVADGVGGVVLGIDGITNVDISAPPAYFSKRQGFVNIRQAYIQGLDYSVNSDDFATLSLIGSPVTAGTVSYAQLTSTLSNGDGFELVPVRVTDTGAQSDAGTWTRRRYQVSLALGMFNQEKLIPTKFMASQLAIEITLATEAESLFCIYDTTASGSPTYKLRNVNLIPEILEFDASYGMNNLSRCHVPQRSSRRRCPYQVFFMAHLHFWNWWCFQFEFTNSRTISICQGSCSRAT